MPVSDVEEGKTILVGRLGRPLGTVCTIEAVVVEVPPKMRTFGDMGRHYGLRIDKIDGTKLQKPIVSRFDVHYYAPLVKLAPNDSELDRLIIRMSRSGEYSTVTQEAISRKPNPSRWRTRKNSEWVMLDRGIPSVSTRQRSTGGLQKTFLRNTVLSSTMHTGFTLLHT